ncbi:MULTISPECIES: kynureninase [Halolamina]|uniref:Kynureninase n=1 Tax=Halolamina pelagica TaxID=699431 RepID=A0A1I5MSV1_9EURY|nr:MULTISPECIES: kynureninase [Halolamina]NHX36146.1 kynureninase [Halolamina sp. R1-12]SFP12648.1 Kynureninase [Halolamina pelagica]
MSSPFSVSREDAAARDADDPLASFRDRFDLSSDLYMDGNSLGPISDDAERTLDRVVGEWRERGIEGWTEGEQPWWEYAGYLGERLAPYVGADADEVVVANSTTVNIHTLIGTFLDRVADVPARDLEAAETVDDAAVDASGDVVVANELDFPTDHYAIRAQFRQRGLDPDEHLRLVESRDGRTIEQEDIAEAMDDDVGILFMPTALYRSGQLFDVAALTELAHDHGALAGFDAAHTVGAVPHEFAAADVDFAVWCSYKYLNAGPGSIAGLYVNQRYHGLAPALPGWWGNEKESQFDLELTYTPEESAGAWQIGTVPMLSAAPLEGSLDLLDEAGIDHVREKSLELTDLLATLVEDLADAGYEYAVGTPREGERRGGHVAVEHPDADRVSQGLRERGVVVDYRPPNVVRICPAPLYVGFEDVFAVAEQLRDVIESGDHEQFAASEGVS